LGFDRDDTFTLTSKSSGTGHMRKLPPRSCIARPAWPPGPTRSHDPPFHEENVKAAMVGGRYTLGGLTGG